MRIGILLTGHAPDVVREREGDYAQLFEKLLAGRGFTFDTYKVVDMEFPEGPEAAEGWLITGSRHGVYDDLPWIAPLEELVRQASDKAVPIVGICFGHQLVAQALGGRAEKHEGGWSVGPVRYDWQGSPMVMNAWHQDQVTALPDGARVIASGPSCRYAGLVYDKPILTVQPHPEYGADVLSDLIETRGPGMVPDALLADARARLSTPTDNQRMAGIMADFLKEHRRG